jgi:glycosyltransferase involved in cell wall biosynthesis
MGAQPTRIPSASLKISVVLCTYNRCRSLANTLQSLAASKLPDTVEWEVLVVDNNSDDGTRETIDDFCRKYVPHFRYLFESRQGKSHALNTGVREARGDVLAFTDDDVVVEATWLENLTTALRSGGWVGAGGKVLPEQGFVPPRWLAMNGRYSMGGVLALFNRGDKPGQLDWAPFGASMAFRREMFEKYGGFRTDLGPPPSDLRGEDTEFGYRLMAAGEQLWYAPSAIAYHTIPANRIRKEYFLGWWFGFGRASVQKWGRGAKVLGIPRRYLTILKIAGSTLVTIMPRWLLALKPEQRFFYKALLWRKAGEIYESYRLAQQRT